MALLTKEQIVNKNDLPTQVVEVPEWGGEVEIRCFTAEQRDRLESALLNENKDGKTPDITNHRVRVVSEAIIDENGNQVFSADDVVALSKKSFVAINKVYKAAIKLSKMRKQDIEEDEKN